MKRRIFVGSVILASISSFIRIGVPGFQNICKQILQLDISELLISAQTIDQFLRDASTECFWDEFSIYKKVFVMIQHPLYHGYHIRLPFFDEYLMFRNRLTGQFLLSTDLFYYTYSQTRKIKYLGYYNPYIRSCVNPFINVNV